MTSLEEIKRMLAAATPGPWQWLNDQADDAGGMEWGYEWRLAPGVLLADGADGTPDGDARDQANAQLIAKAPTLLAELIEQVERANKAAFRIEEIWHSEWVEKLGPDATLSSAHQGELNALRQALGEVK